LGVLKSILPGLGDPSKKAEENRHYFIEMAAVLFLMAMLFYTFFSIIASALIMSDNTIVLGVGALTYYGNTYMCHQLPERSYELIGQFMSLCSRCTGTFVGIILAYAVYHFLAKKTPWVMRTPATGLLFVALYGLDGLTQLFGLRESNNLLRILLGGFTAFFVMYFILYKAFSQPKWVKKPRQLLRKATVMLPLALALFFSFLFVLAGAWFGPRFASASEAIQVANVTAQYSGDNVVVYYFPPKSWSSSIRADEYIRDYDDPVLYDALTVPAKGDFGAWIVLFLDEPAKQEGKYAFLSQTPGEYYYIDPLSKQVLSVRSH